MNKALLSIFEVEFEALLTSSTTTMAEWQQVAFNF